MHMQNSRDLSDFHRLSIESSDKARRLVVVILRFGYILNTHTIKQCIFLYLLQCILRSTTVARQCYSYHGPILFYLRQRVHCTSVHNINIQYKYTYYNEIRYQLQYYIYISYVHYIYTYLYRYNILYIYNNALQQWAR